MVSAKLSTELPYVGRSLRNPKKTEIPFWNALQEKGYSVSLPDRFAYHPHEVTMDLRQGFSLPEGELLLANGQETQIPLFLDQGQPVQRIRADLTPLSSQQFSVWIGQHQAGEWRLQARSTISVEIPNEERGLEG